MKLLLDIPNVYNSLNLIYYYMNEYSNALSYDLSSQRKYEDYENVSDTKSSVKTVHVSFSQVGTINESTNDFIYLPEFGIIHIDELPPNSQEQKAIDDLEIKLSNHDYSDIVPLE